MPAGGAGGLVSDNFVPSDVLPTGVDPELDSLQSLVMMLSAPGDTHDGAELKRPVSVVHEPPELPHVYVKKSLEYRAAYEDEGTGNGAGGSASSERGEGV